MNKLISDTEKIIAQYEIERADKRSQLKRIDDNIFTLKQKLLKNTYQKLFLRPIIVTSPLFRHNRMIFLINHVQEIKLENGTIMYQPSGIKITGTLPAKKSVDYFIIKYIEFNYQFSTDFIPDNRIIIGKTASFVSKTIFIKMLEKNFSELLFPEVITAVNNKKPPQIPKSKIDSVKVIGKYVSTVKKQKHAKNI